MLQPSFALPETSNAVLIDEFSLDRLLARLHASYDPKLFPDLCGLLVQVVLRDRVYLLPARQPVADKVSSIRPWFNEGAAFYLKTQSRAGRKILSEWRRVHRPGFVEAEGLMEAAATTKLPIFAEDHTYNAIEAMAPRRAEHAICDLLTQYMRLEGRAIETLFKYRLVHPSYWRFRVSPLPLEILRRCRSLEDLATATLEVRFEHSSLRRQFAEMNSLISDPSIHPRKKMKEIRKLENSLAAVSRVAEGGTLVTFANSGGYLLNSVVGTAQGVNGAAIGDFMSSVKGGTELLKNGAAVAKEAWADRFRAWRLEPLHRAIDGYMRTSDRSMLEQVARLFGRPR